MADANDGALKDRFRFPPPPPSGLSAKLALYRKRYGLIHALARFVGTRFPAIWPLVGPIATAGYLRRWIANPPSPALLNLGGGGNLIDDALTADIDPRADCYVDLSRPLPFADRSIDLIFLEELIEHVDKPAAARLLGECLRILKPGGTIRVATPDLDWLGAGGAASCDLVNDTFYGHGHRYIYSRAAMTAALEAAGFAGIRHSTYKDPASLLGFLDSHADRFDHAPELSQYLEAKRSAD